MDFVKREDPPLLDEESYKMYVDALQKQIYHTEIDYQHAAISMEQVHQAMHNSLAASTLAHNFQLPISPRQMSTLMLKTNQLGRNINFSERTDFQNEIRTEDLASLRDLEINLAQNMVQLNEQIDLSRNDLHMSLRTDLPQNLELDLSHHVREGIDEQMLDENKRALVMQCVPEVLDGVGQRLVPNMVESRPIQQNEHIMPMMHIKCEQEDDGGFYDSLNRFEGNISGLPPGHIPINQDQNQVIGNIQQDNQVYVPYTTNIPNIPLPAVEIYSRQQNYIQNYTTNVLNNTENPENLVVHRQFENNSPYTQDFKGRPSTELQQSSRDIDKVTLKLEHPKENLKPAENRFYEYQHNLEIYQEKNELSDSIDTKNDGLSGNIKGEFICKCYKVFPTKRGLKQHTKSCCEKEEIDQEKLGKFNCNLCSYKCQSPAILRIHERTHTGEKPFSCTFCDYKSGQKNNVAKHILVHMKEKPFRCQYCEYRCTQKNNLVVHERTHTGHKPFACPYCDYRTVQKPNLVKHMYLHTDQKPFSCDVCNYKCVQKTNLTKHKLRHLNEKDGEKVDSKQKQYRPRQKSFSCPHCPYKCLQKSSLGKHIQCRHTYGENTENFENSGNLLEGNDDIQNLSIRKDFSDDIDKPLEPLTVSS